MDEEGNRIINYAEIEALYNIISLCERKCVRPILITTPYLKEYTHAVGRIDPEFYEDFYEIISVIQRKTGVEYYDYGDDKRFAQQYELFADMDHLNDKGAKIFTSIVLEELIDSYEK